MSTFTDPAGTTVRATWREWLGLTVLLVPLFMVALDMTVLFLALPEIGAQLRPSPTQQLWVLHVGDLLGAGLVLSAGRLSDRLGARRLLVLGVTAYGASSLLAALSTTVEMLIVARGLLGAAAVTLTPAAVGLIRRMFVDPHQLSVAMGLFMAAFSGGMAFGPPVGGLLLEHYWWGSIFLPNVVVALLVLLAVRLLPAAPPSGTGGLDLPSVATSLAAVGLVVFGVQELAAGGGVARHLPMVVVGVGLGVVFWRRQRRLDEPLLDVGLFRDRTFTLTVVAIWLVVLAVVGPSMQLAQHLQVVLGLPAQRAGLLLVVPAVAAVLGTALAPALLRWARPSAVMGAGVLLAAVGAALVAATVWRSDDGGGLMTLLAAEVLIDVGAAPLFGLGAGLVVAAAPAERAGSAAAVQDVSGGLGNTIGLATAGTLAFLSYQAALSPRLPAGLDPATASAARESAGSALATASAEPGPVGSALAEAARAASASSTIAIYVAAAVLLVGLAALVLRGLRDVEMG